MRRLKFHLSFGNNIGPGCDYVARGLIFAKFNLSISTKLKKERQGQPQR